MDLYGGLDRSGLNTSHVLKSNSGQEGTLIIRESSERGK